MIFRFGNYTLDVDVERTRAFYARGDVKTTSQQCTCAGCQNYDKAILKMPAAVTDFLESLGLDPRKPAEAFDVMGGLAEDGKVLYNGFYHLCGVRLRGEDAWVKTAKDMKHLDGDRMYAVDGDFKVSFEEEICLLHEAFPTPVLQMEFDARLPVALAGGYHYVPSAVYTVSRDEQGNVTVREEDAQKWADPLKADP
ncbi:MAG: hypothetical protein IJ363_10750 [Clostridia bacterium]|nr:hypothetical protein [Clostridia bacterium]